MKILNCGLGDDTCADSRRSTVVSFASLPTIQTSTPTSMNSGWTTLHRRKRLRAVRAEAVRVLRRTTLGAADISSSNSGHTLDPFKCITLTHVIMSTVDGYHSEKTEHASSTSPPDWLPRLPLWLRRFSRFKPCLSRLF